MINFRITITGTAPLLMHNGRLANPLEPTAKAIKRLTGKRNKTDEDYEELARVEHAGAFYFDPDVGPYMPGANINRTLLDAARQLKLGKAIERGLFIATDINPLDYDGPRTLKGLSADANFRHTAVVKVGTSRLPRTRPVFQQWRTEAEGGLDPTQLDLTQLQQIAENAGLYHGLGDWRPRFGRFTVTVR